MVWDRIDREAERLSRTSLRRLCAENPARFDEFSIELDDLLVDFTREKLDGAALDALFALARDRSLEDWRDRMFSGGIVNATEGRPALHVALRDGAGDELIVDGHDVMTDIRAMRQRFLGFAEDVRTGRIAAADGGPFEHVISIGIGGSDLGPIMATRALQPDVDGPRVHFVSNLDMSHFEDVARYRDPRRTLVIVQSKSFTTPETLANARIAKQWLSEAAGDLAGAQMAAVSCNIEAAEAFGIDAARVFGFWDWVGGRYSIWSAIGLPLAIAIGEKRFGDFLAGARSMDRHFRETPMERNIPILLALIGVWRRNAMGCGTVAMIPYAQRLKRFPAWLQQLDMESNGKHVSRNGNFLDRATGPIIWGEPGTNGQHSFFQYLHQSPQVVPVDFLLSARPRGSSDEHHAAYLANALAQAQALAFGRTEDEAREAMRAEGASPEAMDRQAPHRTFPGDRPSTILAYRQLDPFTLGRLMALYEHKVFAQGVLWGIDSFDQWGVELGKSLAGPLEAHLAGSARGGDPPDDRTSRLIDWLRRSRG